MSAPTNEELGILAFFAATDLMRRGVPVPQDLQELARGLDRAKATKSVLHYGWLEKLDNGFAVTLSGHDRLRAARTKRSTGDLVADKARHTIERTYEATLELPLYRFGEGQTFDRQEFAVAAYVGGLQAGLALDDPRGPQMTDRIRVPITMTPAQIAEQTASARRLIAWADATTAIDHQRALVDLADLVRSYVDTGHSTVWVLLREAIGR